MALGPETLLSLLDLVELKFSDLNVSVTLAKIESYVLSKSTFCYYSTLRYIKHLKNTSYIEEVNTRKALKILIDLMIIYNKPHNKIN